MIGPVCEDGKYVSGIVTHSGEEIKGSYAYVYGPDYDWTGKASKKKTEVHFIINEYGINLPVEPWSIKEE